MNTGSMTKAELVEEVSRVSDLTKKHSEVIVDTVFKSIIDALHRGEKIELRGFGSFRLRRREPRKGRNPKTGDKVDVPPKKVPYFKPGKELKELINREPDAPGTCRRPARCRRSRHRRSLKTRARRSRRVKTLTEFLRSVLTWIASGALAPAYVTGGAKSDGCVFCAAHRATDADVPDRVPRLDLLRHPQSVSLQQRPPDGGARTATSRRSPPRRTKSCAS